MSPTFAVIGHYTPTDATPLVDQQGTPGALDAWIGCVLTESRAEAESALLWYPDGIIVQVEPL